MARAALAERRRDRETELRSRETEVFARSPAAAAAAAELSATMYELLGAVTAGGSLDPLRARVASSRESLSRELHILGYPEDWLDSTPLCGKCGDSGWVGAELCECLLAEYKTQSRRALSSLFKLSEGRFESFDLSYYDDSPETREQMSAVLGVAVRYAEDFGQGKLNNLFLTGETGLGKTFLAACIARSVSERGYSVVYDTIPSIFALLEDEKFGKGDAETAAERAKRLRGCELLIADDLGTEMQTSFTNAALYELVNSRLIARKRTIITSNLSPEDVTRRYSAQIASRILGEYAVLPFAGRDIRLRRAKK
jgi:DNA replication protein DnaC